MTYADLQRKLHDKPFRPFRIRLANNTTYDVTEPWMVTVGETSAVIVTQSRKDDRGFELAMDWRTVSIAHMLEFSDLPENRREQMVALPLFDVVMSSARAERSVGVAKQLVESALAELSQIERLDDSLAPSDAAQFDRQTAALIRGMYEQWAHDAESLLARVALVEGRFGPVPSSLTLRDAHGRTMAMLSISLDDMEAARSEVASGRLTSSEEVRRELHLGVH